jgi:excisionase family DNA binding protein
MDSEHPLTLTVEQAAKVLGIGRSTAYELVHTGDIPSLRLGRRIVVPVAPLAARLGVDPGGISSPAEAARTDSLAAPRKPSVASTRPADATLF